MLTSNIKLPFEEHIWDSTETVFISIMTRDYLPILRLGNFQLLHNILFEKLNFHFKGGSMCICQISNKEMAEYIAKQTLKNHLVYSIVLLYKVVKNSISFQQDLHLEIIKKKQNYIRIFRSLGNSHQFLTNWRKIWFISGIKISSNSK